MSMDIESQSFTNRSLEDKTRGTGSSTVKIVCLSVLSSVIVSCFAAIVLFVGVLKPDLQNIPSTISIQENRSETQPKSSKLSSSQTNTLFGKFEIQQGLLDKLKHNSSLNETAYPKLNWTHSHTEDTRESVFRLDKDGCVIIPKSGHWFVHSEVSFAYSNTSKNMIWVYMKVNDSIDIHTKKTFTLPKKKYRPLKAHLPVDLTNIIYFNINDTLCVEVSDWRTVYSSGIDNSLTLAYFW